MAHILVDTANTFFRARHVIRGDTSEKVGMAIHIMMNSIKKAWQDFEGTHVVFCLEGRSWRKDHYAPYKRNRKEMADAMTEKDRWSAGCFARSRAAATPLIILPVPLETEDRSSSAAGERRMSYM